MNGIEILTNIILPLLGVAVTAGLFVLGHFMTRLRSDSKDLREEIRGVSRETRENRSEIHRVEVRMGQEFAHKDDLAELRREMKEGFERTQQLLLELFRGGAGK